MPVKIAPAQNQTDNSPSINSLEIPAPIVMINASKWFDLFRKKPMNSFVLSMFWLISAHPNFAQYAQKFLEVLLEL